MDSEEEVKGHAHDDGGIIAEHLDNLPDSFFGDVDDVKYDPDYNELRDVELNEATYVNGFLAFLKKSIPASPNFEEDEVASSLSSLSPSSLSLSPSSLSLSPSSLSLISIL